MQALYDGKLKGGGHEPCVAVAAGGPVTPAFAQWFEVMAKGTAEKLRRSSFGAVLGAGFVAPLSDAALLHCSGRRGGAATCTPSSGRETGSSGPAVAGDAFLEREGGALEGLAAAVRVAAHDELERSLDALEVLRIVGYHAAPIPAAETGVLGGWLLSSVRISEMSASLRAATCAGE